MGTKWKRSKATVGFASFVLGVSLVLTGGLPLGLRLADRDSRDALRDTRAEEFWETSIFRALISRRVGQFIAMGVGGPLYEGDYAYEGEIGETVIIAQETYIGMAEYIPQAHQPSQSQKDLWAKQAQELDARLQTDQNLLYEIWKDGKLIYHNTSESLGQQMDGYSFHLSFNGVQGTCTASYAGTTIDLYGDGFYWDDMEHWYLPGYKNFPAGEETNGVAVLLMVADRPVLNVQGSFASGHNRYQGSELYWQWQNWQQEKQALRLQLAALAAGGLLFALYLLLRKEKPLMDKAIAHLTLHLWFEVKLLLLLGALILLLLPLTENMRYLFQEVTYAVAVEDGLYYQAPWFLSEYLREVLRHPGILLLAFWSVYLFVNDLRYGDKPWRHGLAGILTARGLKLPIQKRLSRRWGLLGLGIMFLGAEIIFFLILQTLRVYLPRWAIWNLFLLPLLFVWGIYLWSFRRQNRLTADIGFLVDRIAAVRNGDFTASPLPSDRDLGKAAQELVDIQQGMAQAVEEQTRSERMKVELITNVSHDLKTPLTSIISYTELLKQEQLPPPAGEYVEILSQKSERLRAMVLDVFEISKATSGDLPVKLEPLDLAKLIRQTAADMSEAIQSAPVILKQDLPQEPVMVTADGDRLYRVFQNLLQNALQYALEGSRVYVSLHTEADRAVASVKNTSRVELPEGVDYVARFVRGDASRSDGGSGLGLAIADSFTRACGGELRVEPVADLFVVTVSFPLASEEKNQD